MNTHPSTLKIRLITQEIAAAGKEYDAPWLKGGGKVTRGKDGRFAKESGGGGDDAPKISKQDAKNAAKAEFKMGMKAAEKLFDPELQKKIDKRKDNKGPSDRYNSIVSGMDVLSEISSSLLKTYDELPDDLRKSLDKQMGAIAKTKEHKDAIQALKDAGMSEDVANQLAAPDPFGVTTKLLNKSLKEVKAAVEKDSVKKFMSGEPVDRDEMEELAETAIVVGKSAIVMGGLGAALGGAIAAGGFAIAGTSIPAAGTIGAGVAIYGGITTAYNAIGVGVGAAQLVAGKAALNKSKTYLDRVAKQYGDAVTKATNLNNEGAKRVRTE